MVNPCAGVAPYPASRSAVLYSGTGAVTVVVCVTGVPVGTTVGGVCCGEGTGGETGFCWTQPPITIIPIITTAKIIDVCFIVGRYSIYLSCSFGFLTSFFPVLCARIFGICMRQCR